MQYSPYRDLNSKPNVIVAGLATPSTLLDISPFKGDSISKISDTCTGIVHDKNIQERLSECIFASSDRFSVDSLTALFSITDQTNSISPDILQQIARTSLYERGSDRDIIHICFILNSWRNEKRSPLKPQLFQQGEVLISNVLFEELLPRLPKIIEKVDYLESYWIEEERNLELTELLLDSAGVQMTEEDDQELDLAIFSIAPEDLEEDGKLFNPAKSWKEALHPIAVHNRTNCSRVLIQCGQKSHFYYRCDSLSSAHSDSFSPRKKLDTLINELDACEDNPGDWIADSNYLLKAGLSWNGEKPHKLTAEAVQAAIRRFFKS